MGPTVRRFKPSHAAELLRLAQNDLLAAGVLTKGEGVRPETTLLMVQQAVEKGIKSALVARGNPVPLTHDLSAIVSLFGRKRDVGGIAFVAATDGRLVYARGEPKERTNP